MYTKFYHLKERPFNLTPDSHFLYFSTQHRDALGHLLYGIRERKGFMLVSGEVGTGKTTLCRTLIKEIEREAEVGFILNSFLSAKELLRAINEDLCCHRGAQSNKELVDELNRFLLDQHERGRTVVVLIDECQNLAMPVLEQIRMLSNLETEKEKLIQIIMVGQPELRGKLESAHLRQLAQRISVTYHLQPLDYRETVNYIHHRLNVASGGDGKDGSGETGRGGVRFSRPALKRIFLYSEGVPRKINILCDRALLVGYVRNKNRITDGMIRRAIAEIQKHPRASRGRRRSSRLPLFWKAAVAGICALAVFGLLFYYSMGMRHALVPAQGAGAGHAPRIKQAAPVQSAVVAGNQWHLAPVPPLEKPVAAPNTEAGAALLLAKLWNRGEVSHAMPQGERDLHTLAGRCGMKAIGCWADIDFLSRANLPCLVRVAGISGEGEMLVVLKSLREGVAGLARGNGAEFSLKNSELEARLRGKATFFYPVNVTLAGALTPGMNGPAVSELQAGLRGMNLLTVDEGGWYGPRTAEAVRRLQARCGLPQDGVAGINENILIMSARGGRDVPRLAPQASRS
ncbi:MAG: AAA family ATPase [Candidatus Aureabacteria bacterium]|nr:AAA family ATPase [Candidatus Auribacterota bacterium]